MTTSKISMDTQKWRFGSGDFFPLISGKFRFSGSFPRWSSLALARVPGFKDHNWKEHHCHSFPLSFPYHFGETMESSWRLEIIETPEVCQVFWVYSSVPLVRWVAPFLVWVALPHFESGNSEILVEKCWELKFAQQKGDVSTWTIRQSLSLSIS